MLRPRWPPPLGTARQGSVYHGREEESEEVKKTPSGSPAATSLSKERLSSNELNPPMEWEICEEVSIVSQKHHSE